MIKLNINSNKVKNILKAIGYLFTVGILIFSISKMVEIRGEENTKKVIEESRKEALKAREEIHVLKTEQAVIAENMIYLKDQSDANKLIIQSIKKDYLQYFQEHQKFINNEKEFVIPTSFDEQSRIITNYTYEPF